MPKHIDDKDKGDAISKIIGDQLISIKNGLLQMSYEQLLKNNDDDIMDWYRKQTTDYKAFNSKIDKQVNQNSKALNKAILEGSKELNLSKEQAQALKKQMNQGMDSLKQTIQKNHLFDVNRVVSTMRLETQEKPLFNYIQKTIQARENLGVVEYKDGKKFKWENYYEMRVRTDISHDITDNMIKDGTENGAVFYICTYYGDCAPDHVDFQGKIYVDDAWESNVSNEELKVKIEAYIKSNKIMTVQEVTSATGNYLTTRPNCRHFFQYISIDEVLDITTEKELNAKREEMDMNFEGKYKPEKYEAMATQRYNERNIREYKGRLEAAETSLANAKTEEDRAIAMQEVNKNKFLVKKWQVTQRNLLKKNDFLDRQYDREAYRRMISDGGLSRENKPISEHFKNRNDEKKACKVNNDAFNSIKYNENLNEILADYPEVNKVCKGKIREIVKNNNKTPYEGYVLYGSNGDLKSSKIKSETPHTINVKVNPNDKNLVLIHTHPLSISFSSDDLTFFSEHENVNTMLAIGHNGTIYSMTKKENFKNRIDGVSIESAFKLLYDEIGNEHSAMLEIAKNYGLKYERKEVK